MLSLKDVCWDLFSSGLVWLIDATVWTSETRSQLQCRPWGHQLPRIHKNPMKWHKAANNVCTVVKSTQVQSQIKSGSLCPVELAKFLKLLNSVVSCFSWSVCVSGVLSLAGRRSRVAVAVRSSISSSTISSSSNIMQWTDLIWLGDIVEPVQVDTSS